MDTATKTASKRVVQKTAEAIRDLIGNNITDKITSTNKSKSKREEDKKNEIEEIYIPLEKKQETIDDLRLFYIPYKYGISKTYKLIRQHTGSIWLCR